jgi:hypothetical protein
MQVARVIRCGGKSIAKLIERPASPWNREESSEKESWSARTEEMSGGNTGTMRSDGPSRSGERETERAEIARAIDQALLRRHAGVLRKSKN